MSFQARSGNALFSVTASRPLSGRDAATIAEDFPAALAQGFAGRILSDRTETLNRLPVRTITVAVDEKLVLQHRVVVAGTRWWVLVAGAKGAYVADDDVRSFFGSFRPAP